MSYINFWTPQKTFFGSTCLFESRSMHELLPSPLWSHVMVVLQRTWVSQFYIIKMMLFVYLCHSYLPFPIITISLLFLIIISFLSPYPLTWIWKQRINMCLFMAILCIFKPTYLNLFVPPHERCDINNDKLLGTIWECTQKKRSLDFTPFWTLPKGQGITLAMINNHQNIPYGKLWKLNRMNKKVIVTWWCITWLWVRSWDWI
jgi:hypothetical protein